MAMTRNIYFQDDVAQKLEGIVGLSKLINDLLRDYFLDDENIIKQQKDNLNSEIKQLEEKAKELKLTKEEKDKQEAKEKAITERLTSSKLPKQIIEWIKVRTEMPSLFEVVNYLKSVGLPPEESLRQEVYSLWEFLHDE